MNINNRKIAVVIKNPIPSALLSEATTKPNITPATAPKAMQPSRIFRSGSRMMWFNRFTITALTTKPMIAPIKGETSIHLA